MPVAFRVHNTLTHHVEPFVTREPGHARMYVCGPTVYNDAHLGHARSYVAYDAMKRTLREGGYRVTHVQNFTDVEEAIALRARQEGVAPLALAERYIARFFEDMDALRVERADHYPRVSQHVEDIKRVVKDLVARDAAYAADCRAQAHTKGGPCDVYFSVKHSPDFGALIGTNVEELAVEAPVQSGDRKSPLDFALWKSRDDWGVTWASPWGPGRPGWHVECAAMSLHHLGPDFDLHGGGLDLVFPHHESERVLAEAWTGQRYCRNFVHNGFVTVQAQKMSKSMGNFVTVRALLARHEPEVLRAFLLTEHYRAPLNYDAGAIAETERRVARWRAQTERLVKAAGGHAPGECPDAVAAMDDTLWAALADDFRFGRALLALDGLLAASIALQGADAAAALVRVRRAARALGLLWSLDGA